MSGGQTLGGTPRPPRPQRVKNQAPSAAAAVPPVCEAPPGFEMLFMGERSNLSTPFEAFILPLHWSLVRGGLRLRRNEANLATTSTSSPIPVTELSELLPANWTSLITKKQEEGTNQLMNVLVLRYWQYSSPNIHFEAKVVEVVKDHAIVVVLFKAVNGYSIDGNVQPANRVDMDSHSPSRNSAGSNFMIADYMTLSGNSPLSAQNKNWFDIYKNLPNFEKIVWEQLMDPIGLNVTGKPKEPGPYESKSTPTQSHQQQQQPTQREPTPDDIPIQPLYPYPLGGIGGNWQPPAIPTGGGGLGRNDLDPLGGFGGGMVADPRGFRQPIANPFGGGGAGGLLPPPPGSRFDPFGPPTPGPTPGRPANPGSNPGPAWGVPNPDGEQPPPGFDDMFM